MNAAFELCSLTQLQFHDANSKIHNVFSEALACLLVLYLTDSADWSAEYDAEDDEDAIEEGVEEDVDEAVEKAEDAVEDAEDAVQDAFKDAVDAL